MPGVPEAGEGGGEVRRTDWIIIDAIHQRYECKRCGGKEAIKLPAPIDAFVLRGKAFIAEHKHCKEYP